MPVVLCLLIGTMFLVLFIYNKFFFKPPVIPNTIKAKVISCGLSQSRMALNMRKDNCPYDLYDIVYEFEDKEGNVIQTMETRKYRENVGEIKEMIISRKGNGHQELEELTTSKPTHIWIYLALAIVAYCLVVFFFLIQTYPDFMINLKKSGLSLVIGLAFIVGAIATFEKFNAYKLLLLDTKVTSQHDAEIFKMTPVLNKKGKPTKTVTMTYKYIDGDVEKIFEDTVYVRPRKEDIIGTKTKIYIDKQTGRLLRLSTALSYRTAGAAMMTCGASMIAVSIVTAITNTIAI